MFSRRFLKLLLPYWIAALIVGSFLPAEAKRAIGTQSSGQSDHNPGWRHRAWHIASFGLTALVVSLVQSSPRERFIRLGGVLALGLAIEVLQPIVFGGSFEWWDVRDDGYGILAAALAGQSRYVRSRLLSDSS